MENKSNYLKRQVYKKLRDVCNTHDLPNGYEEHGDMRYLHGDLVRYNDRCRKNNIRLRTGAIFIEIMMRDVVYRELGISVSSKAIIN